MKHTVKELSYIVDMPYNTLYTYLCHYSFNKFKVSGGYKTNKEFFKAFLGYLILKKSKKYYIERVKELICKK